MKYFLCGLIILGLVAISGCALKQDLDSFDHSVLNQMEQNVDKSFDLWSQGFNKSGDKVFKKALRIYLYTLLMETSSSEEFMSIMKAKSDFYEDSMKEKIERRVGLQLSLFSIEFLSKLKK